MGFTKIKDICLSGANIERLEEQEFSEGDVVHFQAIYVLIRRLFASFAFFFELLNYSKLLVRAREVKVNEIVGVYFQVVN